MIRATAALGGFLLLLIACGGVPPTASPDPIAAESPSPSPAPLFESHGPLTPELVVDGVRLPTAMADAGDGRWYVLEQAGVVRLVVDGELQADPILDLRERVIADGERGLLGIALHPEFASNDRMFLIYSNLDGHTELREFGPDEEKLLLMIPQYSEWHQGGQLAFGPDGHLYVGIGDDGRQGNERADPREIYGTILRLDVNVEDHRYGIPADNPFAEDGGSPEVWDYGLRNPWRFSFDSATDDLYISDVGPRAFEEINLHPSGTPGGLDFGWSATEGLECREDDCDTADITWPLVAYSHEDGNCAIIGGYVVRTDHELNGHYLYGDLCSGRIWSLPVDEPGDPKVQLESGLRISSFGIDSSGTVYVLAHWQGGRIYRLTD